MESSARWGSCVEYSNRSENSDYYGSCSMVEIITIDISECLESFSSGLHATSIFTFVCIVHDWLSWDHHLKLFAAIPFLLFFRTLIHHSDCINHSNWIHFILSWRLFWQSSELDWIRSSLLACDAGASFQVCRNSMQDGKMFDHSLHRYIHA